MRKVHKRYLRELFAALAIYIVLIVIYGFAARRIDSVTLRVALGVLPLIPVLGMIRAIVRVIRDQDERERKIDLEAIAIGAMLTVFGFFSLGMLISSGLWPGLKADAVAIWVLPTFFWTFGVAKCWVTWRHRA